MLPVAITVWMLAALIIFWSSVFAKLSAPVGGWFRSPVALRRATWLRCTRSTLWRDQPHVLDTLLTRSSASSVFIACTVAAQPEREVQFGLTKSSLRSAIIFGASVAGFNSYAAEALMLARLALMVGALA